ncbi:MAG: hypothetical protein ACR2PT_20775 [Endozoicomonas sp.]
MNLSRYWPAIAVLLSVSIQAQAINASLNQCHPDFPLDIDATALTYFNEHGYQGSNIDFLDSLNTTAAKMSLLLESGVFDDSVFIQEETSFNSAIKLYKYGLLTTSEFLDAYDVIQFQHMAHGIYEQLAGMTGAQLEFKKFESPDDPVFIQYLTASPASDYLLENKKHIYELLTISGSMLFHYTEIKLPPAIAKALKRLKLHKKSDVGNVEFLPNEAGTDTFALYLQSLIKDGINITLIDNFNSPEKLYLPSWGLFESMQKHWANYHHLHSVEMTQTPIRPIPSLGVMTRLDVREHRGLNMHPVQLYHPQTSNLLFPHDTYAGTLAGRHDMFHLLILSFWPEKDKKVFHYAHDSLNHMLNRMYKAEAESRPVLDRLEPDFKNGLKNLLEEWLPGKNLSVAEEQERTEPAMLRRQWDLDKIAFMVETVLDQNDDSYTESYTATHGRITYLSQFEAAFNIKEDISLEELVALNYYLYRTIRQFQPPRRDTIADISSLINSIELFQNACLSLHSEPRPEPTDLFPDYYMRINNYDNSLITNFASQEMLRQLYRFWEEHLNPKQP